MVISLALLGYGISGAIIVLLKNRLSSDRLFALFLPLSLVNAVFFSFSMWFCFAVAQGLDINPQELLWHSGQWGTLIAIYLSLALPFFFISNCIVLALTCFPGFAGKIYAADLLGAGAGSLLILYLLHILLPEQILQLLVFCALFSSGGYIVNFKRYRNSALLLLGGVMMSLLALPLSWQNIEMSQYKSLAQASRIQGATPIARYSGPLGDISIVENLSIPLRHAPGLSLYSRASIPEQRGLYIDGDGPTPITRWDGELSDLDYLNDLSSAAAYHLRNIESVLILGLGGGSDILQAIRNQVEHITVTEINPQIIDTLAVLQKDYTGNLLEKGRVRVIESDMRAFLGSASESYDLINMVMLGSYSAASAGLYSLNETYILTVEALKLYLDHLNQHGILSFSHWLSIPSKSTLKFINTAVRAMHEMNIGHPENHIVVLTSLQTSTILLSKTPITALEIAQIQQFCAQKGFHLTYPDGHSGQEQTQFPQRVQLSPGQLLNAEANSLIRQYKFDIMPAIDDRPYFNHYFKWSSLPEMLRLKTQGGLSLVESGYPLLIVAMLQATIGGVLLIIIASMGLKRNRYSFRLLGKVAIYFCSIGLGFLFIEIVYIQKLILFLGHPLYAAAIAIAGFLVFAGLGSAWANSRLTNSQRLIVWRLLPLLAISLVALNCMPAAAYMLPFSWKAILCLLLIAPLAFFMGMPLPIAINHFGQKDNDLIAWAWTVNGAASVLSSVLASLLAMEFGFTVVIVLAGLLYLLSAYVFPQLTHTVSTSTR